MNNVGPLFLALSGVAVGIYGYYNRDNPAMGKDGLRAMYGLAIGQVALGVMFWVLFR